MIAPRPHPIHAKVCMVVSITSWGEGERGSQFPVSPSVNPCGCTYGTVKVGRVSVAPGVKYSYSPRRLVFLFLLFLHNKKEASVTEIAFLPLPPPPPSYDTKAVLP